MDRSALFSDGNYVAAVAANELHVIDLTALSELSVSRRPFNSGVLKHADPMRFLETRGINACLSELGAENRRVVEIEEQSIPCRVQNAEKDR